MKLHGYRKLWFSTAIALLVLLSLITADLAAAGEKTYDKRYGVWGGYGFAQRKPTEYDMISINPYWGIFINNPGPGYHHRFEFCVEGFYNNHMGDFIDKFEIGVRPILRWHYGFGEIISPFIEVSTAGVLYTNLDVIETGSDFNFTNHVGAGFNVRINPRVQLSFAWRLRHISNAGLAEKNSGINHNQALIGLSYSY